MPLLATKLFAPRAQPDVIPRTRLVEQLDAGLARRLTLISAPAGFGKTTLASTWLRDLDRPAAWLSLDEQDANPSRFFTYLVAALQTVRTDLGTDVQAALAAAQPPAPETLLTLLVNDLAALDAPLVLVLDDYHAVDSVAVDEALAFLVEHLPPTAHLAITTREDPRLPLHRLRARGQLTEIRAADLRFTTEEAAAFLNEVMHLGLTAETVAVLEARTEGWIAGLQLAALSLQGRSDPSQFVDDFSGSHRFVMDYLVEEVLHRQPPALQDFLLCTSLFERLGGPFCDAVLDTPAGTSQETLDHLVRANLFVIPLDDERRWYRYHHLFADLLLQRLPAHLAGDEVSLRVADLHRRATVWFEEQGARYEAVRHALEAKDVERAAGLIEMTGAVLRLERQETVMLGWLQALPDALIRTRPVLTAEYVWALISTGQLDIAEGRISDAERWIDAATDPVARQEAEAAGMVVVSEDEFRALPMRLAIYRAVRAQTLGDVDGTAEYAQHALDLASDDDILAQGAAAALLGLASWVRGDLETAHRSFATGMDHLIAIGSLSDAIAGTLVLADIRAVQGRLFEAISAYESSLRLAEQEAAPDLPGTAGLHVGLAELYLDRGRLNEAGQHLATSAALGERAWLPEHRYRGKVAEARLKAAQGDPRRAVALLDEAAALHLVFPLPDMRPIAALKARVWIAQGRLNEAQDWAEEHELSAHDSLSYLREFEHITLARLLLARHERDGAAIALEDAMTLIERLLVAADDGGRIARVIELLVLQARARQSRSDVSSALEALKQALALAEPEEFVQVFVDEGAPMRRLLQEGIALGRLGPFAMRVQSAFGPPATASGGAGLASPLTEREVEVVRHIAAGLKNQEIADRLFISLATVKRHIANAYGKLDARNRVEAIARARDAGLL
ncbi:MAG: LuxR C-terminal-related transcriptional regulator [Bacteroidota bacterium]